MMTVTGTRLVYGVSPLVKQGYLLYGLDAAVLLWWNAGFCRSAARGWKPAVLPRNQFWEIDRTTLLMNEEGEQRRRGTFTHYRALPMIHFYARNYLKLWRRFNTFSVVKKIRALLWE